VGSPTKELLTKRWWKPVWPLFRAAAAQRGRPLPSVDRMLHQWNHVDPHTPRHVSVICRFSSVVYLVAGLMAFRCQLFRHRVAGVFLVGLFVTSQLHWAEPLYTGWKRTSDLAAILLNVGYASVCAALLPAEHAGFWWHAVAVSLAVYVINGAYYANAVQNPKVLAANDPAQALQATLIDHLQNAIEMEDDDVAGCTNWWAPLDVVWPWVSVEAAAVRPTWPNTPQRERAFHVGAVWHAVGIHLITGGAGMLLAWRVQRLGL
jgi:hypothetical protein